MLVKYKVWNKDVGIMSKELATFSGICYDYRYGLCIISFAGDYFEDILIKVGSIEYKDIVDEIFDNASRGINTVDLTRYCSINEDWDYKDEDDEHFKQVDELFSSLG